MILVIGTSNSSGKPELPIVVPWHRRLSFLLFSGRKMFLLVVLYSISNLCNLYAVGTVGAAVATVITQLKVLTTAFFGVLLLGKSCSPRKWLCLIVLVLGCLCVSFPTIKEAHHFGMDESESKSESESGQAFSSPLQKLQGLVCLLIQISISGFASVYFELVLKDKKEVVTVWERNFQLAACSVVFTVLVVLGRRVFESYTAALTPSEQTGAQGEFFPAHLFKGWTVLATVVSLLLGGAGLCVAGSLKYADAVLKCFANSAAIIVVTVVNVLFFAHSFDGVQAIGVTMSVIAMVGYTFDPTDEKSKTDEALETPHRQEKALSVTTTTTTTSSSSSRSEKSNNSRSSKVKSSANKANNNNEKRNNNNSNNISNNNSKRNSSSRSNSCSS